MELSEVVKLIRDKCEIISDLNRTVINAVKLMTGTKGITSEDVLQKWTSKIAHDWSHR